MRRQGALCQRLPRDGQGQVGGRRRALRCCGAQLLRPLLRPLLRSSRPSRLLHLLRLLRLLRLSRPLRLLRPSRPRLRPSLLLRPLLPLRRTLAFIKNAPPYADK